MPIYRVAITVTVLLDSSDAEQAQSHLEAHGLAWIATEMSDGELAGSYAIGEAEALAGDEIARALLAVGEAPDFFDQSGSSET